MGDDPHGALALAQTQLQETTRQAIQLESLSKDVRSLIEQMVGISHMLRGQGDGEKGILWRMSMLEQSSAAMREDVHELKNSLDTRATEDQRGRWTLTQTVTVAIIALIATIAGAIVTGLLGRHS